MTRGWVGLVLEAVFFALAFGWRSWVQWRRTGSTGFIRPRRGAPPVELAGAFGFTAALLLLVAGPVADIAGMARFDTLDNATTAVMGTAIATAGIALTIAAQLAMGDSWRIGVDSASHTELVTSGLFRVVRNPIFSAMVLAAVGLVLLVPNGFAVTALLVLVVSLHIQVRYVEEPYLRTVHGASYEDYLAAAGRFLPRPPAASRRPTPSQ